MFPLRTKTLPTTAPALAAALDEGVRTILVASGDLVRVRDKAYPELEEIAISLDGATLRTDAPRPHQGGSESKPALQVDRLTISGERVSAGPATVDLSLKAERVRLNQRTDRAGDITLELQRAESGSVQVAIARDNLEAAIREVATAEAAKHGVNVDSVRLNLTAQSSRSIRAQVQFRARKLFLSASITITGQLDVDDQMQAKISGLSCNGDGAIASLACGVLSPQLAKFDGRSFSLLALPLGEIRLHNIAITVDDSLTVTAKFGA
jgi:hypothetical protein